MKPLGLKVDDARKALGGISRATLYRMVNRHELELITVGGRSLITTNSIEACVARAVSDAAELREVA